jgi:uncharacterized DUF497 family protein
MEFEWDASKSRRNEAKHRIGFDEAVTVFGDPLAITFPDPDHSHVELRWLTFGLTSGGRLIVVVHTDQAGRVRLISAREATRHERKIYEEG